MPVLSSTVFKIRTLKKACPVGGALLVLVALLRGVRESAVLKAEDRLSLLSARAAHLRSVCDSVAASGSVAAILMGGDKDRIISRVRTVRGPLKDLVYCENYKVASSTMANVLIGLSGMRPNNLFDPVHKLTETLFPASPEDLTDRNKLRMIIVRDPFERILSAYKDKVVRAPNHPYWAQVHLEIRMLNSNLSRRVNGDLLGNSGKSTPSLADFVHYIVTTHDLSLKGKGFKAFDHHWRPFHLNCGICDFDYDLVVKMESLSEDISVAESLTGLRLDVASASSSPKTSHAASEFFSKVPWRLVKRLYQIYKLDFLLFGYS